MSLTLLPREAAAIGGARERFAAGAATVTGVRPAIALSWTRCRDRFGVDPRLDLAPLAGDDRSHCLDRDVVMTEAGGLGAGVQARLATGVVTVVDAAGQVVGSWGDGVPGAADAHLGPWYAWSEGASGTNGMGTALESRTLSAVRGPEHWCEGFHALDCLGVPITDPVTDAPVAAINVSTVAGAMPQEAPELLSSAAAAMRVTLSRRARERGAELASACHDVAGRSCVPVLAIDTGGRVVTANGEGGRLLGLGIGEARFEPGDRLRLDAPELAAVLTRATAAAHGVPGWRGTAHLTLPGHVDAVEASLAAVLHGGHPIGFLMSVGVAEGEEVVVPPVADRADRLPLTRVVARRAGRTLLVRPGEIRYAQAEGNDVWLVTDRGRLRAAERGLKNLESLLAPCGFVRVHRRYLVNLDRVSEVERGTNGELGLFLDAGRTTAVPVSRARTGTVRRRLGL